MVVRNEAQDSYIVGGWIAFVCLLPMFAMWAFMIFGYLGIGIKLKGKGSSGKDGNANMLPIQLQFFNFTCSVAACLLEVIRRLLPLGSQTIVDNCMVLTILFVLFYCAAKWSTYSFLMVKVFIASRGDKAEELRKKKIMLLVMSVLLAITCIAITAVSQGEMFRDSGMCLWFLKSLWIAFLYPFGDFLLSFYLMYAFIKPLKDSAKKTNTDLLNHVIKENVRVGGGCVLSSLIIHLAVGIGVITKLRVQLVTESLVCVDLVCNAIGLMYSTRRSWLRPNGEALSVASDARTQQRDSIGPNGNFNMGKSGSIDASPAMASVSSPKVGSQASSAEM
jgi:hypothetical protein